MIGIFYYGAIPSFKHVAESTYYGFESIGYNELFKKDIARSKVNVGSDLSIIIGDTIGSSKDYKWKSISNKSKVTMWWPDTCVSLRKVPDDVIDDINDNVKIIATSNHQMISMRRRGFKVIGYIGRPIHTKMVLDVLCSKPYMWRRRFGRYLVSVLRYGVHKGVDILEEALSKLKPYLKSKRIRFVAVSDRPIKHANLTIPMGSLTDYQFYSLLYEADMYVCTSRYEGFGLPVLQSMALGTLVIHINAPSYNEFVVGIPVEGSYRCNADGWVEVPPESLVSTIKYAIDMSYDEKYEIVTSACERARSFYAEKVVFDLLSLMYMNRCYTHITEIPVDVVRINE